MKSKRVMLRRSGVVACAAFFAVAAVTLALGGGAAQAGKKPPPPPPPPVDGTTGGGVVYFTKQAQTALWTMAADGSAKTALPAGIDREPGYLLHAGHRWFLRGQFGAGSYPDGTVRREIAAVRDDGLATVQLTSDPNVKPLAGFFPNTVQAVYGDVKGSLRWAKDDSFFSFIAVDWSGGAPVSRLFVCGLTFDGAGTPAPASPPGMAVTLSYVNDFGASGLGSVVGQHDWSPDGGQVAWTERPSLGAGLFAYDAHVTTVAGGATTPLASDRLVGSWSVTGRVLVGDGEWVVESVEPTGANPVVLATGTSGTYQVWPGAWSPTASHLTYARRPSNGNWDVYRARADGTFHTNLTAEIGFAEPAAWR